ncbi:hypothetical protein ACFXA0_04385 [Streptomyces cyaneofuscatus]|uniref:hypothetical protein n=1 Tax=Streptomyces TaxID=1883 RepID=UPI001368C408|nr:hypothetical protein [Streptomyces sp. SID2119]MYW30543.1 hypothetical protein [Streptomyces sp. SID2119]
MGPVFPIDREPEERALGDEAGDGETGRQATGRRAARLRPGTMPGAGQLSPAALVEAAPDSGIRSTA